MISARLGPVARRVLWVAGGLFLALVVVNSMLGPLLDKQALARETWLVRQKWELSQRTGEPVQWLFLGDSACSQAVDPQVWREETGQAALNLCTTENMGLAHDAWLLNMYLRDHPHPRHVVLMNTPTTWRRSMNPGLVRHVPLAWDTLLELRPSVQSVSDQHTATFMHRYLPLVSRRREWLALVTPGPAIAASQERSMTELGFTPVTTAAPQHARRHARHVARSLKDKPFVLSGASREGLNRITYLAGQNEITVWIATPAVLDGLAAKPNFRQFAQAATTRLGGFANKRTHVRLVDQLQTFGLEQMVDATHMSSAAAVEFTRTLARRVGIAGKDRSGRGLDGTGEPRSAPDTQNPAAGPQGPV